MASNVKTNGEDAAETDLVVPIERNGETDITLLDCLIETALLTLGAVPNLRNMNFEATKSKFRKIFPWEKDFEIRKAGSIVDLLYLTKFNMSGGDTKDSGIDFNTDIDVLFIPKSVFVSNTDSEDPSAIAVIEKTSYSGFVTLRYNPACQYTVPESILTKAEENDNMFISSQKFLSEMLGFMNVKQHAADIAGPSLQILPRAMHMPRSLLTSADIVFAFRNPAWPESASEWIHRERPNNWPAADVIEEVQEMGSHVVAKGNQLTPEIDFTWRLSFNMAERHLAENMTSKQRQCFLLVKALVKETKGSVISSYHIKTVLWWFLEQGDNVWKTKSIAECVNIFVEELIKSLQRHVIKNYFLPENNLIKHIDWYEINRVVIRLEEYCKKPMTVILNSPCLTENSEEIFGICPVEEYHFVHLKEALLKFKGDKKEREELLQFFKFHFYNLGSCFVVDPNQREKGISLLKTVSRLLDPQADPLQFVKSHLFKDVKTALQKQNLEVGLSVFAALLTVMSNEEAVQLLSGEEYSTEMLASLFHDTGCVFTQWSCTGFWKQQRVEDLKAAEKCFLTSISLSPSGSENYAEYSHFLLVHGRYTEAIKYGESAVENSRVSGEFRCLSYEMEDRDIIDTSIARHVQYENGITVPAVVIAYHVIVQANKHLHRLEEAKHILAAYHKVCEDKGHKNQFEALSVFGYSCMSLALYKEAKQAFIKANNIRQCRLQEENLEICNKVLARAADV